MTLFRAWVVVLMLFAPFLARADGMVISKRTYAVPTIPDQRALLHYTNGTETLVIETSFQGPGTNFAWVVPLPAVPTIKAVSTGVLPTLQTIFQPRVLPSVKHYWLALPIGAFLLWIIRLIRRESFFGLLVLGCILLVVLFLFGPVLGPAHSRSKAGGLSGAEPTLVQVLNRERVGLFDTATIQSADPQALLRWLNENGFATPTNLVPVLADYVRDGWVFGAARLDAGPGAGEMHATHPLAFIFPTTRPVYPLRLTAQGTASCGVDLYVFGPGRAHVPGFTVQRCERPSYSTAENKPRFEPGALRIRHPELAQLVAQAPIATKLSAVLDAAVMARDAYVTWDDYWPSGAQAYALGAARILSINVFALLLMALYGVWRLLLRFKKHLGLPVWGIGYSLVPVALVAGLLTYLALPKVANLSTQKQRRPFLEMEFEVQWLALSLEGTLGDTNVLAHAPTADQPLTPAESKRLIQAVGSSHDGPMPMKNLFTGEMLRFEASSGNVILRPVAFAGENPITFKRLPGYELVWHDLDGVEVLTNMVVFPWGPGE